MMDSSMNEHLHHQNHPPPTATATPIPLSELIYSLEQAAFMAKQLPSTTNPSHILQINTSLHHAHHLLSSFLQSPLPSPLPPPSAAENSLSSANGVAGGGGGGGEPMQMGDDDGGDVAEAEETSSKCTIDKVEEKLRECFIKNKRAKRPLSPSAAAVVEEKRLSDEGFVGRVKDYDPHAMRLRALELVYQFHG